MSSTQLGRSKTPFKAQRSIYMRRKRSPWRRAVGVIVIVLLCAAALYGARLGWSIYRADVDSYVPLPPSPTEVAQVLGEDPTPEPTVGLGTPTRLPAPTRPARTRTPQPTATPDLTLALPPGRVNILLLGTDKRENQPANIARSDTIVLFSVDTVKKTVGILNIPRDLLVPIPGYGERRVNAAYAIGDYNKIPGGGQALAVQTISKYLKVPIKYYATVNFEGFQKVVDLIGGIYIQVPTAIDDDCYPTPWNGCEQLHFDEGYQFMDGERALKYARTRHADSDFGRIRRQQQVMLAIRQQALRVDILPRLPDLVDQFSGMVETNMHLDTELGFAQLTAGIHASDIYTAAITSDLVIDATDPSDGTDAFVLNTVAAKPMLDKFFGRGAYASTTPTAPVSTPVVTGTPRARRTP